MQSARVFYLRLCLQELWHPVRFGLANHTLRDARGRFTKATS